MQSNRHYTKMRLECIQPRPSFTKERTGVRVTVLEDRHGEMVRPLEMKATPKPPVNGEGVCKGYWSEIQALPCFSVEPHFGISPYFAAWLRCSLDYAHPYRRTEGDSVGHRLNCKEPRPNTTLAPFYCKKKPRFEKAGPKASTCLLRVYRYCIKVPRRCPFCTHSVALSSPKRGADASCSHRPRFPRCTSRRGA